MSSAPARSPEPGGTGSSQPRHWACSPFSLFITKSNPPNNDWQRDDYLSKFSGFLFKATNTPPPSFLFSPLLFQSPRKEPKLETPPSQKKTVISLLKYPQGRLFLLFYVNTCKPPPIYRPPSPRELWDHISRGGIFFLHLFVLSSLGFIACPPRAPRSMPSIEEELERELERELQREREWRQGTSTDRNERTLRSDIFKSGRLFYFGAPVHFSTIFWGSNFRPFFLG